MKVLLFGATGMIGSRILAEALKRGHEVTAVTRHPEKIAGDGGTLQKVRGDVSNASEVATLLPGHEVVISAYAPPQGQEQKVAEVARSLVKTIAETKPSPRLISVGGAGGLEVAPGVRVIDTPDFPAFLKPVAQAHIDAHAVYAASDIAWTFFSPAGLIQPGQRTGIYRVGNDQLIVDAKGSSSISAEDYAAALLDEMEHPKNIRRRMTVGY